MILDDHVAGQRAVVGQNHVVAQQHVVGDVAVGEDMVVRPHHRRLAVACGAVHGDVFAEGVVVADACPRCAALPFQVLRLETDGGEREKLVTCADLGVAVDDDVRMQPVSLAKRDVPADDAVRANNTVAAESGPGMNDCGGMNLRHDVRLVGYELPARVKVISASLTTSPRTVQTPLALATLPRALSSSMSICSTSPGLTGLRHFTLSAAMK